MAETGIVGLVLYLLFIISFFAQKISSLNKNIKINLNGFKAFIFLSLLPILPSGSLFTTWNATPFWIILGLYFFLSKKFISCDKTFFFLIKSIKRNISLTRSVNYNIADRNLIIDYIHVYD